MSFFRRCPINRLLVLLVPLLFIGCGGFGVDESPTAAPLPVPTNTLIAGQYSRQDLLQLFDYDPELPLDIQEAAVKIEANGAERHDITYAGAGGRRVSAYLVNPPGEGPYAGVLFMHWGRGTRETFVNEAIALADHGVVSLMIEAPFRRDPDYFVQTVIDLRRGADLLNVRPEVEVDRLGYVGHSWGATFGAILSDADRRFRTYILMAGMPLFSEFWDMEEMIPLDAVHYLGYAAPASLYFQFAQQDESITNAMAMAFYDAGSQPKQLDWYDTNHAFNNDQARQDRLTWLRSALTLP